MEGCGEEGGRGGVRKQRLNWTNVTKHATCAHNTGHPTTMTAELGSNRLLDWCKARSDHTARPSGAERGGVILVGPMSRGMARRRRGTAGRHRPDRDGGKGRAARVQVDGTENVALVQDPFADGTARDVDDGAFDVEGAETPDGEEFTRIDEVPRRPEDNHEQVAAAHIGHKEATLDRQWDRGCLARRCRPDVVVEGVVRCLGVAATRARTKRSARRAVWKCNLIACPLLSHVVASDHADTRSSTCRTIVGRMA